MYKNIHAYTPFQHDNIEFKNNLINYARNLKRTTPEGAFATALTYANVVDYLAKNLLENLLRITSIYMFTSFGGTVFLDGSRKRTSLPLGTLLSELGHFEFPNKKDFLESLEKFNGLRNEVMHNLMQLDPNDTTRKFDKSIEEMGNIAEDILAKFNVIASGLGVAWTNANAQTSNPQQKN